MKFVLFLSFCICVVKSQGTFDVSVSVESICMNIYDHGDNRGSTSSQLKMTVFMPADTTSYKFYHYSSPLYPYDTTYYVFQMSSNTEQGQYALPASFVMTDLSPADDLVLGFFVEVMITNSTLPAPVTKCPDANHLFINTIVPSSVLKNATSSAYSYPLVVNLYKLHTCDNIVSGCSTPAIHATLNFTCTSACRDLLTTTPIPTTTTKMTTTSSTTTSTIPTTTSTSTTTTIPTTVTSTTTKFSTPTTNTSTPRTPDTSTSSTLTTLHPVTEPEGNKSESPGLIAAITVAVAEFVFICVGLLYCLQRYRRTKRTAPASEPNDQPTPEGPRPRKVTWNPKLPGRKKVGQKNAVRYNSSGQKVDLTPDNGEDPEDPIYSPIIKPVTPKLTKPRKPLPTSNAPIQPEPDYADVQFPAASNQVMANNEIYG